MRKLIDSLVVFSGIVLILVTLAAGAVPVANLAEYASWLETPAGKAYSASQAIHGAVGVACGLVVIFAVDIAEMIADRLCRD